MGLGDGVQIDGVRFDFGVVVIEAVERVRVVDVDGEFFGSMAVCYFDSVGDLFGLFFKELFLEDLFFYYGCALAELAGSDWIDAIGG
jgi:hypothetical protein